MTQWPSEQLSGKVVRRACAVVSVAALLLASGCSDPLRFIQERPGDLAPRLSGDQLGTARSLRLEDFRKQGSSEAPPSMTAEQISARASAATATPADAATWSLADALSRAVQNNLQLRAALVDPRIAEEALNAERGKFEAVFTPSLRYRNDDQPTLNTTASNSQQVANLAAGVSVPLRTGGRATINATGGYTQSSNPFLTTSEAYSGGLDASVSLPLLRGSGREINSASIKIAGYQADIALARTKLQVIGVLASTERAYWNLVAARQELVVRQKQLELAQEQLEAARRRVTAGSSAEIEVTRAESGVASSLNAIISAETAVLTSQRELKRLVSSEDAPVGGDRAIAPSTPPEAQAYDLDTQRLLQLASANRTELVETELALLADALNIDLAKDATLPAVSVEGSYSYDGLGRNVFGATRTLSRGKFQSWGLGISGEIPLAGNQAAEARLRQSMLTRIQRLSTLEDRKQTIEQDVLDAVDRVGSAWQRIIAAQQSSILAGRTLEAERRQFDAGTRTSTDVLDASARLADSQSQEVRALADYRLAIVELAVATGTVLGAADVRWDTVPDAPGPATAAPPQP